MRASSNVSILALTISIAASGCKVEGGGAAATSTSGIGSRVFVVERNTETMAVYDIAERRIVSRIPALGNLQHAIMTFSRDLRYGYVATRSGKLSQIDLSTLEVVAQKPVSKSSIDIAISQDGRYVATAEYVPGGVTILDSETLEVVRRIPANYEKDGVMVESRATGIVDAPGNRFIAVLIEAGEIWIIDASKPDFPIEYRIPARAAEPYDAMITPDGRNYVVGHRNSDSVSVLDLAHPERGAQLVSLREPGKVYDQADPVKLPHLASWAVARDKVFVPLVGEKRLAVLDRDQFTFIGSVPLRGHPVYSVRSPSEREIWVSFSGEEDDAFIQVVDVESLSVKHTIRVGKRIYHLDFTPRGGSVLVSANQDNKLVMIDAATYSPVAEAPLDSPSGVFGPWRAFVTGL